MPRLLCYVLLTLLCTGCQGSTQAAREDSPPQDGVDDASVDQAPVSAVIDVMDHKPVVQVPGMQRCQVIIPDEEVHCPDHRVDGARNDIVYLDTGDGTLRAGSVMRPQDREGDVVLEPFLETGWGPGVTSVSPDGQRLLVARSKNRCDALDCSFGRPTLWLAQHRVNDPDDPSDDTWQHINLTRRLLGRNSEIHGWTTWLHRDLALFNALVRDDDAGWVTRQEDNTTQVYALCFTSRGPVIEPFAPAQL